MHLPRLGRRRPDDAPCGRGDRHARPFRAPAGRHTAALQVSL